MTITYPPDVTMLQKLQGPSVQDVTYVDALKASPPPVPNKINSVSLNNGKNSFVVSGALVAATSLTQKVQFGTVTAIDQLGMGIGGIITTSDIKPVPPEMDEIVVHMVGKVTRRTEVNINLRNIKKAAFAGSFDASDF